MSEGEARDSPYEALSDWFTPTLLFSDLLKPPTREKEVMEKEHPIAAGFSSGAIAGIVASLFSLPLVSPQDAIFNTASVTFGCLAAGVSAGVFWGATSRMREQSRRYAVFATGLLLTLAIVTFGVAIPIEILLLERTVSFVVSLTAIALTTIGLILPLLSKSASFSNHRLPILVLLCLASLGIGIGLFMVGDAQVTDLELPPRSAP